MVLAPAETSSCNKPKAGKSFADSHACGADGGADGGVGAALGPGGGGGGSGRHLSWVDG